MITQQQAEEAARRLFEDQDQAVLVTAPSGQRFLLKSVVIDLTCVIEAIAVNEKNIRKEDASFVDAFIRLLCDIAGAVSENVVSCKNVREAESIRRRMFGGGQG